MIAVFQDGSVETKSWYFLKVRIESFPTIPYLNQSEVGGLRSKLNKLVEKYGEIPLSARNKAPSTYFEHKRVTHRKNWSQKICIFLK